MLFTLEKGDMFEVSMASVECIVGKSNGITLLILKSGNVLSVPPEIASTKKLTKLWDTNNIASVKDGDCSNESSDEFWKRVESYRK